MQLYTRDIGTRIGGSALGLGFIVIGIFAVSISGEAPTADVGDRAFWLGVTFAIAGVSAVAVSWLVSDLSNIWCKPPSRFFRSK
jgi:drug/metabolite transporter (DMT)-like permease